ncbi:MAG: HPP family protein, partial [Gemmatimonadaceae bacterium]
DEHDEARRDERDPDHVEDGCGRAPAVFRGGSIAPVLDMIWVPFISASLIVLVGAIGSWMRQPWLFAALAPTILMVAASPGHETTNFRAIVVGHLAAIACGYLALILLNATGSASMLATRVVPLPRIWASAAALAMLAIVQPQLRSYHPPAAATALLVTLGAYRMTGKTPLALMGGVVVVAIASEMLVRFRSRRG